jgi:hypothetical protein
MDGYIGEVLKARQVTGYRATPALPDLYEINEAMPSLDDAQQEDFHSLVMTLMFAAVRARPDVLTPVGFLSGRVNKATNQDKAKINRVLMYLNSTPGLGLCLCADGELRVYAYVDASFAVHTNMRSHTGVVISLGGGPVHVSSKKQGLMTKSSTESELVGVSDALPQVLWTRMFLEHQGHKMGPARVYQDNMSTIALASKGRSTSSRTRHIGIRYFFVHDKVELGEVEIEYLPTEQMRADIMTKPLQGDLFRRMRDWLMGVRRGGQKQTVANQGCEEN